MKNIWTLFVGDLKRLTSNVVTVIIVLGLVFLPSLFSWYNLIACWNVFDNTGNLKVAVANEDAGYSSDLMPIEVNIGEKVVSELRANAQLKWTFTSAEDAIDGAKSGALLRRRGDPRVLQPRHDDVFLRRRRARQDNLLLEREEKRHRPQADDRPGRRQGVGRGEPGFRQDVV